MDLIKGIFLGFAVYFASSIVSKYTGINEWSYIICFSSGIIIYTSSKNISDKDKRKTVLKAIIGVAVISICTTVFIQYIGSNIDKWF